MRKLAFIVAAVIISGSVALAQQAIDINNPSFEYAPDGNLRVAGRSVFDGVLGWEDNAEGAGGWVGVDVMCPYANSNHCHRWPGPTDPCGTGTDVVYAYLQHDSGCNCYQILDMSNSDANAVIQEGRRYTLRWDALVRQPDESGNQIKGVLFYLGDPCTPDVNQIIVASKVHTVLWIDRPTQVCKGTSSLDSPGDCPNWNRNLRLDYVAQADSDGKTLGIKFQSIGQMTDNYTFVDNVRLEWQWATQAYGSNPDDGAVDVPKNANLIWSPGLWVQDVNGHDVYFGSTWAEVNSATTASNEFKGSQDANEFDAGTMVLGDTYYWRIDEVNKDYNSPPGPVPYPPGGKWEGEVWSFTVEGRAKNPEPADAATDVPRNVILRWTRGAESLYHDVYFGSTEAEVTSATTGSGEYTTRLNKGTEEYDAGGNHTLIVDEDYFWRIDEVNLITVKGHTWDFMVADYILIDDFDSYANHGAQRLVWRDSLQGLAGNGEVYRNTDANYSVDGNSMRFDYWNASNPFYSETMRSYTTGQDWSYAGAGVTALEIDFFGDVNSVPDPPMYVKLSDGPNTWQVNPGPNDVTDESQHTWNIPLKDFNNVNLSNITAITLGIGDKKGEGGPPAENGTIYFDDIRLQPPRCYPEHGPAADFTEDCRVDVNDLMIVVKDWCKIGSWGQPVPVIEYLFEEGSGTTVANTGTFGSDYDLTIGLDDEGAPEPNNDPCWYSDADPCRGWTLYFDGEKGLHPGADANGGDYLIIPAMNLTSNTVTITAWVKPDGPQYDGFIGLVHHTKASGDEGCAGLTYASGGGFCFCEGAAIGYVWNDNSQNTWAFETGIYIPEQQWSMMALVVEPTRATLYLYDTNGTPSDPCDDVLSSATHTLAHNKEEFDGKTFIAGDARSSSRFFGGHMDGVRIYNHSLSQDQILDVADDIPLTGIMYYPLSSDADLCVGNKSPNDVNVPIDDQIDLCDWSKFADEWLETKLWPEP